MKFDLLTGGQEGGGEGEGQGGEEEGEGHRRGRGRGRGEARWRLNVLNDQTPRKHTGKSGTVNSQ